MPDDTLVDAGGREVCPLFTIFTPTYNRAHTLHRVYDSLHRQTLQDFEWLVIDDGSEDGTDQLVGKWQNDAGFRVRYVRQSHGGKHVAYNRALDLARGRFFTVLDSDDALVPDALNRLYGAWNSIPERERHAFCGVDGLCEDQHGRVIGDRFPSDPFDATLREAKYLYRLRGEKWGVGLTAIVREYRYPEMPGVEFVPEGIVWLDIAKKYKSRSINEVVRIYYVDDAQTGATLSRRTSFAKHASGRWQYYIWMLKNDLEFFFRAPVPFLKAAVMLPVTGWYSGQGLGQAMQRLERFEAKLLVVAALPVALVLYALDRLRSRSAVRDA
jgi:glycosyltransferase involved in cell wall biosynthesis